MTEHHGARRSWSRLVSAGALLLALAVAWVGVPPAALAADKEAEKEAPQIDAETGKRLNEALEALNAGKYGAAEAAIAKLDFEQLSPYERSRVEQILASISHSKEDYAGAGKHLQLALQAGGLNEQEVVQVKFQVAQLLLADEHWKEGAAALEEWFTVAPEPNSAAYYMLASAYYQMGDYQRAIAPAKKAVDLAKEPQTSWVELLLALYLNEERWGDAVPMLERMIAAEPAKKAYWQQLWSVYGQQQKYAQALAIMELADHAGLITEGDEYTRMAEQMMYVGMPYRAARLLERVLEEKKIAASAELYEKLGNAWLAAKEFGEAVPPFERAFELGGNAALGVRVGEIHMQENRWEAAEAALRRALAKGGLADRHNAELLLGIALYSQQRYEEAREAFEQASAGAAHRQLARGYLRMIEVQAP